MASMAVCGRRLMILRPHLSTERPPGISGSGASTLFPEVPPASTRGPAGAGPAPAAAALRLWLGASGAPARFSAAVVAGLSQGARTLGPVETLHAGRLLLGHSSTRHLTSPGGRAHLCRGASPPLSSSCQATPGSAPYSPPWYVFPPGRQPQGRGRDPDQPRPRPDAAAGRRRGQRPVLEAPSPATSSQRSGRDQPGHHDPRRPRRLRGQGAPARLHGLPRLEVCGMGPPSSGALTVGQILGMLLHTSTWPGMGPAPRPPTCSWRRPSSPSPTAACTWPTATSSTCPRACSIQLLNARAALIDPESRHGEGRPRRAALEGGRAAGARRRRKPRGTTPS